MITLQNGHVQNQSGLLVANGSVTFQLNTDATVIAAPGGLIPAGQKVIFQLDANGNILPPAGQTAAKIYSNLELEPQNTQGLGTYYLVAFYDANGARLNQRPMWWQFVEPANSTVDISLMTPYSTVGGNVIFYPIPIGGGGSVTSVAFVGDGTVLSATPSAPVTSSGNISATLLTQNANTFLAGPTSGSASAPTFRAITASDLGAIISLSAGQVAVGSGTNTIGGSSALTFTGGVFTLAATTGVAVSNSGSSGTVINDTSTAGAVIEITASSHSTALNLKPSGPLGGPLASLVLPGSTPITGVAIGFFANSTAAIPASGYSSIVGMQAVSDTGTFYSAVELTGHAGATGLALLTIDNLLGVLLKNAGGGGIKIQDTGGGALNIIGDDLIAISNSGNAGTSILDTGSGGLSIQTTNSGSVTVDGITSLLLNTIHAAPTTIGGVLNGKRILLNQGTAYSGADSAIVLGAGWGTGAAVSGALGTDQALQFTVTAGTGPTSEPQLVITFKDGAWPNAPLIVAVQNSQGASASYATIQAVTNTTTATLTWRGLPVAGSTYTITVMMMGV